MTINTITHPTAYGVFITSPDGNPLAGAVRRGLLETDLPLVIKEEEAMLQINVYLSADVETVHICPQVDTGQAWYDIHLLLPETMTGEEVVTLVKEGLGQQLMTVIKDLYGR